MNLYIFKKFIIVSVSGSLLFVVFLSGVYFIYLLLLFSFVDHLIMHFCSVGVSSFLSFFIYFCCCLLGDGMFEFNIRL